MKIKQIEIKNFQSHKHTIIDLHDGMNVILGESHNGKSSIIRAIKWMMSNQPHGDGFCSWFNDSNEYTEVIFHFDDKTKLIRRRNKDVNCYIKSDGESCKVGRGLPPSDILDILNMSDINLLSQDDDHFMLGLSGGERAQKINDLIGLNIIGEVLKQSNIIVDRIQTKKSLNDELIDQLQDQIDNFEDITNIQRLMKKADKIRAEITSLTYKKQQLAEIIGEVQIQNKIIQECEQWLEIIDLRDKLQKNINRLMSLQNKYHQLDVLLDNIDNEEVLIDRLNKILDKKSQIQLLQKHYNNINKMIDRSNNLNILLDDIDHINNVINDNNLLLKDLLRYRNKIDVCPVCHQKIMGWNDG